MLNKPDAINIFTAHLDAARYGVSGSPDSMRKLVGDIAQSVTASLTESITASLTASITASVTEKLRAEIEAQAEARAQAKAEAKAELKYAARMQELYEQIALMRQRQFGRSSEAHAGQGQLFNEADALAQDSAEADEVVELPAPAQAKPAAASVAKQRGKRAPLPADLPRVDIVHDVPESERVCACGTPMVEAGEIVSEQLDIVPMQIRVLRHIRKRYVCPDGDSAPITAARPAQVLPKSNASSDLLAMLMTVKYVDGLPLARFEHVCARSGVRIPRVTTARWIINGSQALQPLHNLMRDHLLASPVIHMDETPVQVLKEPGKAASSESYMWVQTGGAPGRRVVLYDYDPTRSGQVPLRLLEGWKGYLMTDGFSGYNPVTQRPGVEHLICMAHARRGFVEAIKSQGKNKSGLASEAIEQIGQLYGIERTLKTASDEQRHAQRQQLSLPVLAKLRQWLDEKRPLVPPTTALGKALTYLDNHWSKLIRYTERGNLPIDNNVCENSIRPFVNGRKAWLFSDTQAGAHASALIYSLVETCKANGREPYSWLRRVLRELPYAETVDDYEALLPWNIHALDLATEAVTT